MTGVDITFSKRVTADGNVNQFFDATTGTLTANNTICKTGRGNLTLAGGTAIDLNNSISVLPGSFVIQGAFTATNDLTASCNVTLSGIGILDGVANQRIDAVAGILTISSTLTKATNNLTLGGGTVIDIDNTITVVTGSLTIEDAFYATNNLIAGGNITLSGAAYLDGSGDQTIDAAGGTLTISSSLTKSTNNLTLGGDTAIHIDNTITVTGGSLTIKDAFCTTNNLIAGTDITLSGAAYLDGSGDQTIDAAGGTLTISSTLTKATNNLTLGGDTAIDLNGPVVVTAGSLTIQDAANIAANLTAGTGITLLGKATFDGIAAQAIDAGAGTLTANDTITKTGMGNLVLSGHDSQLRRSVRVSQGNLELRGNFFVRKNLYASQRVTLSNVIFNGKGEQKIRAKTIKIEGSIQKKTSGELILSCRELILSMSASSFQNHSPIRAGKGDIIVKISKPKY